MRLFAQLYAALDQTTRTNEKVAAMIRYFKDAPPADAVWTVALLTGRRPARPVRTGAARIWAAELAGIPMWLFDECHAVVGDLSETISLLVPTHPATGSRPLSQVMQDILELKPKPEEDKKNRLTGYWQQLTREELFVFNKLIGGSFRVGVSAQLVYKALANVYDMEARTVAHRLMGNWSPQDTDLGQLLLEGGSGDHSKPYPFYLACQLDVSLQDLGDVDDWLIERKYDGIRGQLIVRNGEVHTWSRGEELMTEKFVEFLTLNERVPDGTVIDGEILPYRDGRILPFSEIQKRIGRKNLSRKILDDIPLCLMCYDLLEHDGKDIRKLPLQERRSLLEQVVAAADSPLLQLSPLLPAVKWQELDDLRQESQKLGCEGLMLKHRESIYETGRRRGKWWKWKVDPYTVDAVLIYAQPGSGRRANLYTDYTFAVWDGSQLVPFAKAYSGLTDEEIREVDNWIRKNTVEKFGPVRSVRAEQVFELAFEGIQASPRHKSGIALRFPRIQRWRKDKKKEEANTKSDLLLLLQSIQHYEAGE